MEPRQSVLFQVICAVLCVLVVGCTTGFSRSSSAEPAVTPEEKAKTFVDLLVARKFAEAENDLDAAVKGALPEAKLGQTWDTLLSQAGPFKRQVSAKKQEQGGYTIVLVTCEFEKTPLDIKVVFDKDLLIGGLFFVPVEAVSEYSAPGYVKPSAFHETEVTVGSGEWALPGTLTLPVGSTPVPAVVLVHGSGPNDRDETLNPGLLPFRDLAWGLASQGIAVLRYEKRTKHYNTRYATFHGKFTVQEETIDDAVAAVELLRKTPGINPTHIFVLGHSLGGMLIPRIGLAAPHAAGFIVLAGLVRNLEDTILDQITYIASLQKAASPEADAQIAQFKEKVARIKSLTAADATNTTEVLIGAPPAYWLDLRGYDPPTVAKTIPRPFLILQGGRDYQVTMEDYQLWKAALSSRHDVTFHAYANLNHCFVEGEGKAVPAEYSQPGHVAEKVVADIAQWVKQQSHTAPNG